jgi:hypothetical protein
MEIRRVLGFQSVAELVRQRLDKAAAARCVRTYQLLQLLVDFLPVFVTLIA